VVDGDDATATQHNTPLLDLQTDANTVRPIVAGGTGGNSASAARTALGLGTIATQGAGAVAITGGTITGTTVDGVDVGGFTAAGLALLDDADTAAQRATLGVQSVAEVTAGGVGSYALLQEVGDNRTARSLGSTADGSLLRFAAISGTGTSLTKGNAASGTWSLMGEYATFSSSNDSPLALWFRIS
jgi:hypothetical protein